MKKYVLAGLLGFVLIWPISLESKQLFVQVSPLSGSAFFFASSAEEMENLVAADSTFLYELQFFGEEDVGDIDYRISNFSYSGFSFRAGLKFKF